MSNTFDAHQHDDDEEWIPCEVCETLVRFRDYSRHITECALMPRSNVHLRNMFFTLNDETLGMVRIPMNDILSAILSRTHSNNNTHSNNTNSNDQSITEEQGESSEDEADTDDGQHIIAANIVITVPNELQNEVEEETENQEENESPSEASDIDDHQYNNYAPRMNANGHRSVFIIDNVPMTFFALNPENIVMNDYEFNSIFSEVLGNVELGIEDITTVTKELQSKETLDEDDLCVICQDSLTATEDVVVETLCKHRFCKTCLSTWLAKHKKCPTCMVNLEDLVKSLTSV